MEFPGVSVAEMRAVVSAEVVSVTHICTDPPFTSSATLIVEGMETENRWKDVLIHYRDLVK